MDVACNRYGCNQIIFDGEGMIMIIPAEEANIHCTLPLKPFPSVVPHEWSPYLSRPVS
jgi:hypothetical protein